MRKLCMWTATVLALTSASAFAGVATRVTIPPGHFATLAFHDVRDRVAPGGVDCDPYAISTKRLAQLFDWMQAHDWHPVSVAQIRAAHQGKSKLPANAVLLSFDDGLESVYSRVYPLLRAFHYPALIAIETRWLRRVHGQKNVHYKDIHDSTRQKADETQASASSNIRKPGKVFYNGSERGAAGFLTWAQIRDMQRSGLVTVATHTDNLHHGILANPQGNMEPAAMTRLYDPRSGSYETRAEFRKRLRDDFLRSIQIIKQKTGYRIHVVVWPYGAMTREANQIAHSVGLDMAFGLNDRKLSSVRQIGTLGRFLVAKDPKPMAIVSQVDQAIKPRPKVRRAIQVDLDDIYDPDPKQVNKNLGALLNRIKAMHVRTVYLQAFADPDGNGTASALYFPNHYLPMRADLFNRVAWQLTTRAQVRVYAWLPLLAFELPNKKMEKMLDVKVRGPNGKLVSAHTKVHRLSPFSPRAQKIVSGIYTDLSEAYAPLHGILIGDDAYLGTNEGAYACTRQARWPGSDKPIPNCRLTPRAKTRALIDFSHAAIAGVRQHINVSNGFRVSRNLFARVVMDPSAESRFSQALGPFLKNYDEVALMAMPYLDGTSQAPKKWLARLEKRVASTPGALHKVVFELQTRNWNTNTWIPPKQLRGWMRELIGLGALNLAYYPDDFLSDKPAFKPTFEGISLNEFPHRPGLPAHHGG